MRGGEGREGRGRGRRRGVCIRVMYGRSRMWRGRWGGAGVGGG